MKTLHRLHRFVGCQTGFADGRFTHHAILKQSNFRNRCLADHATPQAVQDFADGRFTHHAIPQAVYIFINSCLADHATPQAVHEFVFPASRIITSCHT